MNVAHTTRERPTRYILYPFGGGNTVDEDSMMLASQAGYKLGFMNVPCDVPGCEGMNIPRFALARRVYGAHLHATMSGFKHLVEG